MNSAGKIEEVLLMNRKPGRFLFAAQLIFVCASLMTAAYGQGKRRRWRRGSAAVRAAAHLAGVGVDRGLGNASDRSNGRSDNGLGTASDPQMDAPTPGRIEPGLAATIGVKWDKELPRTSRRCKDTSRERQRFERWIPAAFGRESQS